MCTTASTVKGIPSRSSLAEAFETPYERYHPNSEIFYLKLIGFAIENSVECLWWQPPVQSTLQIFYALASIFTYP
ncbi:hypothetical protein QG37_06125 [Candidozyma auris]|nr:hypothetical protein QG37_06125 [[Candida] auris]